MKKLILPLLLLFLPLDVFAQADGRHVVNDLFDPADDTNFEYCLASEEQRVEQGALADVSSSTTVTGTDDVFAGMAVGDLLYFRDENTVTIRKIVTYTSTEEIVVDSAVTLTGATTALRWRDVTCATTATAGWIDVGGFEEVVVQLDITTLGSTSITMTVQGKIAGGTGGALFTTSALTATGTTFYIITEPVDSIRVGLKVDTDGTDLVRVLVRKVSYEK